MLLEGKLTTAQQLIIRHICSIQLQSLQRIYDDEASLENNQDLKSILVRNEIDEEKFEDELMLKIDDFKKLKMNPNILTQMKDDDLSTITHIMVNISDKYSKKYPQAVKNIYSKIFFIRDVKLNYTNN